MIPLTRAPVAHAQMLIRKPVEQVFEAFADPAVTTKFWFTKSSGRLEEGRSIRWEWEMYGVGTDVEVKRVVPNERIVIEWGAPNPSTVEWTFVPQEEGTFVTVKNSNFNGNGDEIVAEAIDSMGGFTMVLCALKALLEHGVVLNVVADRAPDSRSES
ncbi:SRPBCC family protein [Cohnella hongkongensis]|uniref:SRPBCC family protein n=1 Tax=Cohnella hongkongensis TaxID=178337 RepID=A0ABV9F7D0_9BACL